MAKTVTANGNAQVSTTQSKFGGASLRIATANSDHLSTPDSADFAFGSGDFTVDFWLRSDNGSGSNYFMGQVEDSSNFNGYLPGVFGSANSGIGGGWDLNATFTSGIAADTWYHYEVGRNGNTWYLFIDGVSKTVTAAIGSFTNAWKDLAGSFYVGGNPSGFFGNDFVGYLDEVRVSKGICRHTANFTPETSAYTTDANTVLLLHCDGANGSTTFVDSSGTTDYNLALAQGSFSLTGVATTLTSARILALAVGSFVLTGISALFTQIFGWGTQAKNTSTVTPTTKHSATMAPTTKNTGTWTPQDKN